MNLGNLSATLSLNIQAFVQGITTAQARLNNLNGGLNNAGNATRNLGMQFKDLDRIVSGILISQAFYRATNAIQDATSAAIGFAANMETAQISMEYFLGSADRAKGFLEVMKDFAATTPFSTEQALDSAKRLMAMGFAAESLKSVMTIMTDASAVTGATADQMNRVVLALGQMKTNGYIAGQELRQLAEAGIPAYKILQEELGLTTKQLKSIGKLKISGDAGVAAILKGLEKRYKGGAARIANTFNGMWSTIRDDMLIGSEKAFKGAFGVLEDFTRKLRDSLEHMREVLTVGGVGGLFHDLVPPELQTSIKLIVRGLQMMGQAFKIFYATLKPIVGTVIASFIIGLGQALPMIGAFMKSMALLLQGALQVIPGLKLLATAIVALLVANLASKALMLLWSITRIGVICTAVAQAVMVLAKSIQLLFLVATKNPVVGVIMAIAAALLYVAFSSKAVAAWLDTVTGKLANMAGMNLDKLFVPENNKSVDEWSKAFNERLEGMSGNLKDVGKNAAKAGKKVKDSFASSFDELYQIPDTLGKVSDELADIGDPSAELGMPDLSGLGGLPTDISMPDMKDTDWGDTPWWAIKNAKPPGPKDGGGKPPELPPPDASAVTTVLDTVNGLLAKMRTNTKLAFDGFNEAVTTTSAVLGAIYAPLGNFVAGIGKLATGFADSSLVVNQWAMDTGKMIGDWFVNTTNGFVTWATNAALTVSGWSTATSTAVTTWASGVAGTVATWATTTGTSFVTWAIGAQQAVYDWASNTAIKVASWSTTTSAAVAAWALGVGTAITAWSAGALGTIYTWASNTATKFAGWSTTVATTVRTWGTNVTTNIGTWATNTATNFATWVKTTSKNFANWATNVAGNVLTGLTNMGANVYAWASGSAATIASWISGTATSIGSWATGTAATMSSWAGAAASVVGSFASASWGTLSSWLDGTGSAVFNWASGMISTLINWAKSAWGVIKKLAGMVGKEVGDWSVDAGAAISNGASKAGAWAGEHKTALITAAVVAGIVTASIALAPATGGVSLVGLAALETGGIVDQDQLVRIGEGNKREAVIPLENSTYMKPFSAAVASDLAGMLGDLGGSSSSGPPPIMYVGTLIADDRSLKELSRKMQVIQVSENQRKGM